MFLLSGERFKKKKKSQLSRINIYSHTPEDHCVNNGLLYNRPQVSFACFVFFRNRENNN